MSFSDLSAALDACGIPWCMDGWTADELRGLPYIVVCSEAQEYTHADNRSYARQERWRIELYSDQRSFEDEAAIASALDGAGFAFTSADAGAVLADDTTGAHLAYFWCSTLG